MKYLLLGILFVVGCATQSKQYQIDYSDRYYLTIGNFWESCNSYCRIRGFSFSVTNGSSNVCHCYHNDAEYSASWGTCN